MKTIINHHYQVRYKPVNEFTFGTYNSLVDVISYKKYIMGQIDDAAQILIDDINSRQSVISINRGIRMHNSCCLTLQFQIVNEILILIANYRSQCQKYGRPNDTIMLKYIATIFLDKLKEKNYLYKSLLRKPYAKIFVNVGNYHQREDIEDDGV